MLASKSSVQRCSAVSVSVPRPCRASSVIVAAAKPAPCDRVYNFSAGPAVLPLDVLEKSKADLLSWNGCGISVMEMSHRGPEFDSIIKKAEADLRTLIGIPDNYKVLFLQGGASTLFAGVPLNLTSSAEDVVDHLVTGAWSKKAVEETEKYCKANIVCKGNNKSIPDAGTWKLTPGAKYVHYCDNETIGGVEFQSVPDVGSAILVSDMSSNFISRPIDIKKFGIVYAGAQKNVGPAGVTICIVRDDLIGHCRAIAPTMLDFKTHAENDSMYNTPSCWSIYICGLVFEKLLGLGGLEAVAKINAAKAKVLYDAIDSSNGFYTNPVEKSVRSMMNVPFIIPGREDLEKAFLKGAEKLGMVQLKGHRSVGGMRASIYNAMPIEGVQMLATFMKEFAATNA